MPIILSKDPEIVAVKFDGFKTTWIIINDACHKVTGSYDSQVYRKVFNLTGDVDFSFEVSKQYPIGK